jgi:hypothetical protein
MCNKNAVVCKKHCYLYVKHLLLYVYTPQEKIPNRGMFKKTMICVFIYLFFLMKDYDTIQIMKNL